MEFKKNSLRTGFEPAREDPNGFQVHRLNHSAIAADMSHALNIQCAIILTSIKSTCCHPFVELQFKMLIWHMKSNVLERV